MTSGCRNPTFPPWRWTDRDDRSTRSRPTPGTCCGQAFSTGRTHNVWDGHTTEEKYVRLRELTRVTPGLPWTPEPARLGQYPDARRERAETDMLTAEAVVFFRSDLVADFEYRVMQSGQLNSKMRFPAAQWTAMLRDGAWLRHAGHANRMAARLVGHLRAMAGVRFPIEPATNMIFAELAPAAVEKLHARGWRISRYAGGNLYRMVCAWDTTPEDVDEFARDLQAALSGQSS